MNIARQPVIVGVDCDLREITWKADTEDFPGQYQGDAATGIAALTRYLSAQNRLAVVLYEIAGAVDYTDNKGAAHNKRRWTIYNVATAARLHELFAAKFFNHSMVVAPSSAWTGGYTEKQRHLLYNCTAATHDLRECEAMARSYLRHPAKWVSFNSYIENL